MTAGKNAIKGHGTDEPVKDSENKQGNAKEYLALEQLPSLWSYKPILTFLPPASINLLIFSCAHRCTRYPIPLLKLSPPIYVLQTGKQITEKYLKIVIKELKATGHTHQRDTIQYRLVLTD